MRPAADTIARSEAVVPVRRSSLGFVVIPILVLCVAAFGVLMVYSASYYAAQKQYGDAFYFMKKQLLGLVLGVMAQLGDFFESALKRSRSVKDSGNVLPGHGGVLDRVDSLLFVIPTYECARALMTFF